MSRGRSSLLVHVGNFEVYNEMWKQGIETNEVADEDEEFLIILHGLRQQGLVKGLQFDLGCGPWPVTNIWTNWQDSYGLFERIRQSTFPRTQLADIKRILVDNHYLIHELRKLTDRPITAQMELRAFYNEQDLVFKYSPDLAGRISRADPKAVAEFNEVNNKSLEEVLREAGAEFADGITISSLLNYVPWMSMLKRFDKVLKPGGLLIIYNSSAGFKEHIDWPNYTQNQEEIIFFIKNQLNYEITLKLLKRENMPKLYIVANKPIE